MVATTVEGIDLFHITGRSISGWVPSFKEVIPIDLQVFQESRVALVECPNCASTRTKEQRRDGKLKFPSHDKCNTHPPNTEPRWARKKTIWEVVGG